MRSPLARAVALAVLGVAAPALAGCSGSRSSRADTTTSAAPAGTTSTTSALDPLAQARTLCGLPATEELKSVLGEPVTSRSPGVLAGSEGEYDPRPGCRVSGPTSRITFSVLTYKTDVLFRRELAILSTGQLGTCERLAGSTESQQVFACEATAEQTATAGDKSGRPSVTVYVFVGRSVGTAAWQGPKGLGLPSNAAAKVDVLRDLATAVLVIADSAGGIGRSGKP